MRRSNQIAASLVAAVAIVLPALAFAQASPSAFTTATRYDPARRVVGTIAPDPDGAGLLHFAAVRNTYDAAGRLTLVEKGELASWQDTNVLPKDWTGFSVLGKLETSYDAMNRKTVEIASGRLTVTSPWVIGSVTQYSYDALGRLECTALRMNPATYGSLPASACSLGTTGSFGPDRITRNVYDPLGQLLRVQKAYGVTTANGFPVTLEQDYVAYTYSPNGKQASVTDANGNKASMTYDGLDRETRWNFPDKVAIGTVSSTDYEEYGYDANGNRTSLRKRDGATLTFRYDALNRVVQKRVPDPASGPAATATANCQAGTSLANASDSNDICYSYDLRGLQTAAQFGTLGGTGLASTYDGFGRLSTSVNTMGGTSRTLTYLWDADGNRTRVTHPDGNYWVYGFDGLNRMNALLENGSSQIGSITYDAQGRRVTLVKDGVTTSYGYDPVSRLASLTDDLTSAGSDLTSGFTYSPSNQITGRTRSNSNYVFTGYVGADVHRPYAGNGLNQYTSVGGTAYAYDANGNLTGDGINAFAYDAENRLISASGAVNSSLIYDPMGRLFQVGTKQFLYDGDELIAEYASTAPTTVTKRYVHGASVDDPWFWYDGAPVSSAARYSMQSDHQGSIVSMATASGALLSVNTYDEYGIPASANIGRFQYTGQAWLPEIGMYYYKARIYSPTLGRFLQIDPIGYDDQVNLYAYVANDPLNKTDPSGRWTCANAKSTPQCDAVAKGLADAARLAQQLTGSRKTAVLRAIAAYGKRGVANGVIVRVGSGGLMNTDRVGKDIVVTVGNDNTEGNCGKPCSSAAAHEGAHIADYKRGMPDSRHMSPQQRYDTEARGAFVEQSLDRVQKYSYGANPLWSPGMTAAEMGQAVRYNAWNKVGIDQREKVQPGWPDFAH